jgi:hypothetical protein
VHEIGLLAEYATLLLEPCELGPWAKTGYQFKRGASSGRSKLGISTIGVFEINHDSPDGIFSR